jgi:hypothetical protein
MLELEALGPMETIPPKGQVEIQEHWTLYNNIPPIHSEADVEEVLSLLI